MNLAVQDDESYIANGIVVHNCKSYLVANLTGSGKELDKDGLKPSKANLDKYITLADLSAGAFALISIDVSKKKAMSQSDARKLALEILALPPDQLILENEMTYQLPILDQSMIEPGSLKSFEPMEGMTVYYGRIKSVS